MNQWIISLAISVVVFVGLHYYYKDKPQSKFNDLPTQVAVFFCLLVGSYMISHVLEGTGSDDLLPSGTPEDIEADMLKTIHEDVYVGHAPF